MSVDEFIDNPKIAQDPVTDAEWDKLKRYEKKFKGNEQRIESLINRRLGDSP